MFGNTMILIRTKKFQRNVRPAMKKIIKILKVVHLMAFLVQVTEQSDCGTYRADNGRICRMCYSGNYKIGDCMEDGMPARCVSCPGGTYQTTCNQALRCAPCSSYCPYYFSLKISECNATSDIKCQCQPGFYFHGEVDGKCIKHKSCPPSQGVKMQGTPLSDTVCEPCNPGKTFSNVSSNIQQCQNCTTCRTISECTPANDTVCANVAVEPDNVLDQHGLSIGHIVGIVIGACVVGIIVIIGVALAVGYYRLHRNHPGKPRNPNGECPQIAVELSQAASPETYQVAPFGAYPIAPHAASLIAPPVESPVTPLAAIQVAPPAVSQVAPAVAEQVAPPEASDFIYRMKEEMNDIERSTEGDTVVDAGPISDSDVHLHNRHFKHLSERQDTPSHGKFSVSSDTELKQIARGPINVLQHEQPDATGQDSLIVTPNNRGTVDHHKGPTGNNTWTIPTGTVNSIHMFMAQNFGKEFNMFYRDLDMSITLESDTDRQDVDKLIEQMHMNYKDNVVEANYQLLKRWSERYGRADENFCKIITNALRRFGANNILDNLQVKFRKFFPLNGGNHSPVRGEI